MASEKIVTVTPDNLQEVISSDQPVLVDFWAPWCGPCKQVAPTLDQIAEERDNVTIAKLDVQESPELAAQFGVQGIPAFLLFEKGEVKARMQGALPKAAFDQFLDQNV